MQILYSTFSILAFLLLESHCGNMWSYIITELWKQITFSFKSGKSLNLGHNLNGKFFSVSRSKPNGNCRWFFGDFKVVLPFLFAAFFGGKKIKWKFSMIKTLPEKKQISILFPASNLNSHETIGALRCCLAMIAVIYEEIGKIRVSIAPFNCFFYLQSYN